MLEYSLWWQYVRVVTLTAVCWDSHFGGNMVEWSLWQQPINFNSVLSNVISCGMTGLDWVGLVAHIIHPHVVTPIVTSSLLSNLYLNLNTQLLLALSWVMFFKDLSKVCTNTSCWIWWDRRMWSTKFPNLKIEYW